MRIAKGSSARQKPRNFSSRCEGTGNHHASLLDNSNESLRQVQKSQAGLAKRGPVSANRLGDRTAACIVPPTRLFASGVAASPVARTPSGQPTDGSRRRGTERSFES